MKRTAKSTTTKATTKFTQEQDTTAVFQTGQDAKDALLIVSIAANLFVVILWVMLQVTSQYDAQLVHLFIGR